MKVKEENQKAGLKLNIQKTKIMKSGPITSWQIDQEKNGSSDRFFFFLNFLGFQNHCNDSSHEININFSLEEKL